MRIHKIFLDLDDTLNSFTMFVLHRMGVPVGVFDYHKYPVECGYSVVCAYNRLTGQEVTEAWFWGQVNEDVWASAPRSPEYWNLLSAAITLVGSANVGILTRAINCPQCWSGKFRWFDMHLPDMVRKNIHVTQNKTQFAEPGVLLVDDSERQCNEFRKAGGCSILVSRPWNQNADLDTWQQLSKDLRQYKYART